MITADAFSRQPRFAPQQRDGGLSGLGTGAAFDGAQVREAAARAGQMMRRNQSA